MHNPMNVVHTHSNRIIRVRYGSHKYFYGITHHQSVEHNKEIFNNHDNPVSLPTTAGMECSTPIAGGRPRQRR